MGGHPVALARLVDRYRFAELVPISAVPEEAVIETVISSDEVSGDAAGALVLSVGARDADDILRELRLWANAGATALVVRSDVVPNEKELADAQAGSSIVVLTLGASMSWLRFSSLVSAELGTAAQPASSATRVSGEVELFDLADSIAALVDGPVTIEDLSSTILAFSSDHDRADTPRKQSILGRRVSAAHNEILAHEGIFDQIYSSAQPVFLKTTVAGSRPRAAIRIKAGDDLMGSIWAVVDSPLSPVQAKGMHEASSVVALAMLHKRLSDEAHSQERLSLVTRLIEGGSAAAAAAIELGIGDAPAFVVAIRRGRMEKEDATARLAQQFFARTLSTFITSVNLQSAVADVQNTIYAVIPVRGTGEPHEVFARRFTEGIVRRAPRDNLTIGYGEVVNDITQLVRSRRQADVAVRVGRSHGKASGVVAWRDVQVDALMLELTDTMLARHEGIAQPLARVVEAEARTGLLFVSTLSAYLEHLGDVTQAASSLFVHPNTFRYRLRKLESEAGVDLKDPQTRFELLMQLRLEKRRNHESEVSFDNNQPRL